MNKVDFLSAYPQVYVGNKERAKNKFGGFLSSTFALTMLAAFIFYIKIYIRGEDFNVKYFRKSVDIDSSTFSKLEYLNYKEIELFLELESENNDCRIHPFLLKNNYIYDESNITKCNENLDIEPNGSYYCFNFSFFDELAFAFSGNCYEEDGKPIRIEVKISTTMYKIDHKSKYPFQKFKRSIGNLMSYTSHLFASKNTIYNGFAQFTPILYNSEKIFSNKIDTFKELYWSNIRTITYTVPSNADCINNKTMYQFYNFKINIELDYDVYEREYIDLLDTLSKIGGFFSPVKLAFSILIQFYSGYEVNYQIVKNLILKKNIYKNNLNNNKIKIDKSLELNVEKALNEKKNNINSCLHFFGTIFKCCCQKRKTLRILNKCNEFITEHMSAENLIFNSILFEKYYEDNPIRNIENIEGLKEIEEELYNYNCDDEKELLSINEFT